MERVAFSNRGKEVVGNLFTPTDAKPETPGAAIVVTRPFGAVKEQVSTPVRRAADRAGVHHPGL